MPATLVKTQSIPELLTAFKEAVKASQDMMIKAGKALVDLLDAGATKEQIAQETNYTKLTLDAFERIGRGQVFHRLYENPSPGYLAARQLPFSDQERVFIEGVKVFQDNGNGADHRLIPLAELTSAQANQVFARNTIRSLGEQRSWLEEKMRAAQAKEIKPANNNYKVHRHMLIVHEPLQFTRQQLLQILQEME